MDALSGLLDTSIFIADEHGRALDAERLPAEAFVSTATLAELELGVHVAADDEERARRLATLTAARERYVVLPLDEAAASAYAELFAGARRNGRRVAVQDTWIAACAKANGLPVVTQDADFDLLDVDVVRV